MKRARVPKRLMRLYWALAPMLIVLGLSLPGYNQGDLRTDSHIYTAVTLRMLQSGDFIEPMLGNNPYHNKPPLAFWLQAPALKLANPQLFPPPMWATRVHVLVVVMLTCLFTFFVMKELVSRRMALGAALVVALTHEVFRYTRAVSLDMVVLLMLTAALWPLVRAAGVRRGEPRNPWIAVWSGVPIGLALLTKPILGLLFFPIAIAWALVIRQRRLVLPLLAGVLVAIAVAAPWHIAMHLRYPDTFIRGIFGTQSLDRAMGETGEGGAAWQPLWMLCRSYVPWIVPLVLALGVLIIRRRSVTGDKRADWLALLNAGTWLIALSVFSDKRMRYLAPVYPSLALLVSAWIVRWTPRLSIADVGAQVAGWKLARAARLTPYVVPIGVLVVGLGLAIAGVRVHAPPPAGREELLQYLDSYRRDVLGEPGALVGTATWPTLWHAPDARRTCAHIYIQRGVYPSAALSPETPWGGQPKAGDLMFFYNLAKPSERYRPRAGDVLLGHFDTLSLVRLGSDWTGQFEFGSAPKQ
ncbi:MAG: glycosyltransferase family 39 protein [Phycisphaerales bacterium]|nr:glycosyltransferase family 39 protein [Phycisphaerales bacterium]